MIKKDFNIIIIDDDPCLIESLKKTFKEYYTVQGFTNLKDGLFQLQRKNFDILILNHGMNNIDGNPIKEIRRYSSNIYILLLTEESDPISNLNLLRTLDIQGCLEKTSDYYNIILQVESIIKSIELFKKDETLGDRLKHLRKVYKLSQEDIAKYLGVQTSSISQYESNKMAPPSQNLIKLAKLFNVTTDYILCYNMNVKEI